MAAAKKSQQETEKENLFHFDQVFCTADLFPIQELSQNAGFSCIKVLHSCYVSDELRTKIVA